MSSKAHLCPRCGENTIYFEGICHSCKQRQRRDEILNLSADEAEAMIQKIADRIDEIEKWDEIYNDFWALFSLRGLRDARIARAAVAKEIYYPPELYRGAPQDVRDALIAKLASLQGDSKNVLNDVLCALAWQADEQTARLFYELYQNPRPWRQKLYVGTEIYAQIGGWTFDSGGKRRSLVFDKCFAAVRIKGGASSNLDERASEGASKGVNLKAGTSESAEGAGERLNLKGGAGLNERANLQKDAQDGEVERLAETSNLNASAASAATLREEAKQHSNLDEPSRDTAKMAAQEGLREYSNLGQNAENVAAAELEKLSNLNDFAADAAKMTAKGEPKQHPNLNENAGNAALPPHTEPKGSLNSGDDAEDAVQIGELSGQKCEFCGCEMLDMLRLKASEPRLAFLNLKRDAVFRCCPNCIGSVRYFCKSGADGELELRCEGEGMEKSYFPPNDLARLGGMKFRLSEEVSPFFGCFGELDTTVGGYPQWVQDAEYLTCPSCGGTMKHLAQIPLGELVRGEGVVYVQICERCEVLGGCFQCT